MFNVEVIVTTECNLRCVYCHIKKDKYHITDEEIKSLLNYLSLRTEPYKLSLYGGEPLLYWDECRKIIEGIYTLSNYSLCSKIEVCTNGVLLKEEIIDFCEFYNVEIQVSFDAYHTDKTRPHVSGIKLSSFYKKLFHLYGDRIKWAYTTNPSYAKDLHHIVKWFINEGIPNPRFSFVKNPSVDSRYFWTEDTVNDLITSHKKLCNDYAATLQNYNKSLMTFPILYYLQRLIGFSGGSDISYRNCTDNRTSFYKGKFYLCYLWANAGIPLFHKSNSLKSLCKNCEIVGICDKGCQFTYTDAMEERLLFCKMQKGLYNNVISLNDKLKDEPQWQRIFVNIVKGGFGNGGC